MPNARLSSRAAQNAGWRPGACYQESIIDAIDRCQALVLVFSSHANGSPHVLRGVTRAVNEKVAIIPFRVEDVPHSLSMEYPISISQWIDATEPPLAARIDGLIRAIGVILASGRT